MNCCSDEDLSSSPPYISYLPSACAYGSIASSASSSTASIWSDTCSQSSDDSSVNSVATSDSETLDVDCCTSRSSYGQNSSVAVCWTKALPAAVAPQQRQHPRRDSLVRSICPPQLIRQSDRKVSFVDSLVGKILLFHQDP